MIPISTHLIRVERNPVQAAADPWESAPAGQVVIVAEHVRAVIAAAQGSQPGRETETGSRVVYTVLADPCDLTHRDVVVDEATGDRYPVQWVVHSPGLAGLASVRAGLSLFAGPA